MQRRDDRSAAPFIPVRLALPALKRAAAVCTGCDLYRQATQTVFGDGPPRAELLFVGEQPGDQEDRTGRPFIGPAGRVLDRALADAGIARTQTYVTNAVKHFKWEPLSKRRKHKKPSAKELAACRPWLEAEVQTIKPRAIVCLGTTAAQAIFGKAIRLHEMRNRRWKTSMSPNVFVTVHPSAILHQPDAARRSEEYKRFVGELRRIARSVQQIPRSRVRY
ncbi:Phage SPO1 DNA polymerase-related protein [Nitrospira sp. KM1]|uniref:UdgX family uracil-DNA binding protein n=1 Tax=Nitrospira sp. KM1 TaxID=1936990 RepID=UPI0013A7A183|nr:UdgX family uracil-DNA binding protein [Nitrospira sp. KM1]BCA55854.1 Phage SPO1 DNA polymerase-related protein [Nitrospira sp. KM1]